MITDRSKLVIQWYSLKLKPGTTMILRYISWFMVDQGSVKMQTTASNKASNYRKEQGSFSYAINDIIITWVWTSKSYTKGGPRLLHVYSTFTQRLLHVYSTTLQL